MTSAVILTRWILSSGFRRLLRLIDKEASHAGKACVRCQSQAALYIGRPHCKEAAVSWLQGLDRGLPLPGMRPVSCGRCARLVQRGAKAQSADCARATQE